MKSLLAVLVALVGVLSPAFAQNQGRERHQGNNGNFPRGGMQHGGGQGQQGGGQQGGRRDFPRQERGNQGGQNNQGGGLNRDWNRGNQNRGNDQRRERTWTPPQNNQGGSQERHDRGNRDNDQNRRRIPDTIKPVIPVKPNPNPDQWRRDERREDRNRDQQRGGTVIRRPDNDQHRDTVRRDERRRDDHQGRLRGRLGGPQQTPARKEPILRQDPAHGRRFGSVLKPSLRDRADLEPMYRNHPKQWPDYRQAPSGYTRWDRAPRRSDWNLTIGAGWIGGAVALHHQHENRYGGYWWHEEHGTRYAHHCDSFGRHWYGWYVGSNYYWTRWQGGYFWWYDPIRYRWVYWHERRWWYQDPANITIVYVYDDSDDRYYRYDDRTDRVVLTPETPANNATDTQSFYSTDGSRLVQVVGPEKHGYLHDTAETPSFEPVYLGKGISEVRFKYVDGGDGDVEVDQVLVLKADGTFDVFDGDGYAKGEPEKQETPALDSLNQWEKDPHE